MFIISPGHSIVLTVPGHKSTNKNGDKLAELVFIVVEVDVSNGGSVWIALVLVVVVVVVIMEAGEIVI